MAFPCSLSKDAQQPFVTLPYTYATPSDAALRGVIVNGKYGFNVRTSLNLGHEIAFPGNQFNWMGLSVGQELKITDILLSSLSKVSCATLSVIHVASARNPGMKDLSLSKLVFNNFNNIILNCGQIIFMDSPTKSFKIKVVALESQVDSGSVPLSMGICRGTKYQVDFPDSSPKKSFETKTANFFPKDHEIPPTTPKHLGFVEGFDNLMEICGFNPDEILRDNFVTEFSPEINENLVYSEALISRFTKDNCSMTVAIQGAPGSGISSFGLHLAHTLEVRVPGLNLFSMSPNTILPLTLFDRGKAISQMFDLAGSFETSLVLLDSYQQLSKGLEEFKKNDLLSFIANRKKTKNRMFIIVTTEIPLHSSIPFNIHCPLIRSPKQAEIALRNLGSYKSENILKIMEKLTGCTLKIGIKQLIGLAHVSDHHPDPIQFMANNLTWSRCGSLFDFLNVKDVGANENSSSEENPRLKDSIHSFEDFEVPQDFGKTCI